jgi:hypothetical protein
MPWCLIANARSSMLLDDACVALLLLLLVVVAMVDRRTRCNKHETTTNWKRVNNKEWPHRSGCNNNNN